MDVEDRIRLEEFRHLTTTPKETVSQLMAKGRYFFVL
jgi:hypothetical protein